MIPLNAIELEAIAESATDAVHTKELALGRVDGDGKSLGELINQPSLDIHGRSSDRIGEQAANIIPATATAALDLRLVKRRDRPSALPRIRQQCYCVVTTDPDDETRLAHPRIARVWRAPARQPNAHAMDLPLAQRGYDFEKPCTLQRQVNVVRACNGITRDC